MDEVKNEENLITNENNLDNSKENEEKKIDDSEQKNEEQKNEEQKNEEQSYYEDQKQRQQEREQQKQQKQQPNYENKNNDNDNNNDNKQSSDKKDNISSGVQEENVWQDFLKEALSKGKKKEEGTLIVLGSKTSGKASLIGQFKKLETKSGEMKKFLMMRYSYVQLSDSDEDKSENLLHIYQVSDAEHCKVLDVVIPKSHMKHLSYMICLDLSRPYEIKNEFNLWMNIIKETQERLLSRLSAEEQQQLKEKTYKHIQHYQNPHSVEQEPLNEEEKSQLEIKKDNPEINLSVPIIVVATKTDLFKKLFNAEADADDHYDIILSYIRLWSLKYGAASFTMARNLKDQARRILSYLDHRMFDTPFSRAPNEVVSLSNLAEQFLFIPSGHDTVDLIKTQGQNRPFEDPFENYFSSPKQNSKKSKDDSFQPKSDNENMFLKHLEFEIQQAPSSKDKANPAQSTKNNAAVQKFFNHLLQGQTPSASKGKENAAPTNP